MIKLLKQKIIRWTQNQSIPENDIQLCSTKAQERIISSERENRMTFTIHFADGGQIIESTQYDSKRDEYLTKLYVVQEGESISEKLENIICVEALRR